jgi:hypothetical protein
MRAIATRSGSTFVLCTRSDHDPRFPRYPPLPVASCVGYERPDAAASPTGDDPL